MSDRPDNQGISRRRLLGGAAIAAPAMVGLGGLLAGRGPEPALAQSPAAGAHAGHGDFAHASFAAGTTVDHRANGFDPSEILRDFDYGTTRRLASGRLLREWTIVAEDKEIEVAPGVKYEAWTYNGRVPGPTLRASEGELLRINFVNASEHPHTMHFHGIHRAPMDGMPGIGELGGGGQVEPGESFAYEFEASPFGLHLYHCHVAPLAAHIARGLYGAFVIDPKQGRPEADEMVMVMNGFDTNFDLANEVYAVNTVGFHYVNEPIRVGRGEPRPHLPRQRPRVRPDQLLPHPRQLLPALPDRDLAAAERVHRHGDPGAGPARRSSSSSSPSTATTCSTPTSASSPSSAGPASSGSAIPSRLTRRRRGAYCELPWGGEAT